MVRGKSPLTIFFGDKMKLEEILKNAHEVCEKENGRLKNLTIEDLQKIRDEFGKPDKMFGDPVEAMV